MCRIARCAVADHRDLTQSNFFQGGQHLTLNFSPLVMFASLQSTLNGVEECNAKDRMQSFFIVHYTVKPLPVALNGADKCRHGDNDIAFTFDMTRGDLLYEVSFDFIRLEFDDKNGLQIARVELAS